MTARLTEKAAAANGNGPTAPAPNTRQNSDNRRANKPLMEKRRRARINQSLSVLKTLIVDSNKLEGHKHSKLEKADILEMTVTHLQGLRKVKAEPDDDSKFREGFEECTRQVSKFLSNQQVDKSTAEKLFHHLNGFSGVKKGMSPPHPVNSAQSQQFLGISTGGEDLGMTLGVIGGMPHSLLTSPSLSSSSPLSFSPNGGHHHSPSSPCPSMKSGGDPHEDNKSRVSLSSSSPAPSDGSLSGIQVIPTRLANGQVVFLLPNGHPQGLAMSVKVERDYASGSSGSEMEMDEPLDCSKPRQLQQLNSPVNLSCKSANQIVPDEDSVWRPW